MTADCVAGSDSEFAPLQGVGLLEGAFPGLDEIESLLNMFVQYLAVGGQPYMFCVAEKKLGAQLFFQQFNRLAYCRLRNIKCGSGSRKT